MNSEERLAVLGDAIDGLDYAAGNTLAHAMIGSLACFVTDDEWDQALALATKFVAAATERRREIMAGRSA